MIAGAQLYFWLMAFQKRCVRVLISQARARVLKEDQELEQRVQKQQSELPTTLDAFRWTFP